MPSSRDVILVVEDEEPIAETIMYALETEGFQPVWIPTGREAWDALSEQQVTLIILDIGLPDINGFDLCRKIRASFEVPIIFLTSRSSEVDKIVGLEIGGDDYMAKPFSPRELTARVRAVLRRVAPRDEAAKKTEHLSGWEHDVDKCRILYAGQALTLTRNEYRLLSVLIARPGRVFSRDQLMEAAWDDPGASLDRTVDAHIKSLRAKLRIHAPNDDPIVTHRGLGYSLREI